jgi:uncharacterized protein (DUF697 family)
MTNLFGLSNIWNIIREVDLTPLRQQAQIGIAIAIVGEPGTGRRVLADGLRCDPSRPDLALASPVTILDVDNPQQADNADLIILLLDARQDDQSRQSALARAWADGGKRVLVFINHFSTPAKSRALSKTTVGDDQLADQPPQLQAPKAQALSPWVNWKNRRVVYGSPHDPHFLQHEFAKAVIELLPDKLLALGRAFPLFRVPIAHHLINDTCLTNSAYSLSTGLASMVPILDIPLYVTDMVILTKNQAFMAYKLGLALGLPLEWRYYLVEFGAVLGSGFIWRQIARSLVGLIPLYGIIPKVAIAYAGTYVVGQFILQWYLSGRHITRQQMHQLYIQAFTRGRSLAKRLRRPGREKLKQPTPKQAIPAVTQPKLKTCPDCKRMSSTDALFCQYCGHPYT